MNSTCQSIIATLSTLLCVSAQADLRTWTDIRGNKIEAELVENMHGNVTLRKADGNEAHISISGLSATDQKYVLKNSPPKINIRASEITYRKNMGLTFENPHDSSNDRDIQIQTTYSRYKVTLSRSGTIPYDKPIQAELYVIGYKKQSDEFVLLSKTVKKFTFDQGDVEDKFIFTSNQTTTRSVQGGNDQGTKYFGNLVVLVDYKGGVFNAKGTRSKMEEHTAFIRKLTAGAIVTKADLASAMNEAE